MRTRVFGHLLTLSPDALDRRRLGDVLTRLGGDVAAIESFVLSGVASAFAAVLQIVFFVGALFYLQWDLALVSLIVAPLFFVVARRFSGLIKRASREKRRRSGSLGAVAEQTLGNVALVQASRREGAELDRYRREGEGVIAAELSSVRIRGVFSPLVDLIELAGILLVVYFGTRAIARRRADARRDARLHRLPDAALRPGARPQLALQHRLQGAGRRRARDRAARRAAAGDRRRRRAGPRARRRRARRRVVRLRRASRC